MQTRAWGRVGLSIVMLGGVAGCPADDPPSGETEMGSSGAGPGGTTSTGGEMEASSAGGGSSDGADSTGGDGSTGMLQDTGDDTEGTTGGALGDCTDPAEASYRGTLGALDVLFVVDNSATMGEPQGRLAASMDSFVARLDNEGLDYRIAVTTTDVGNPWCSGTTPEG
ncbi:MAG: hypothetical protein AAF721_20450, partial [Myxococcota bacterium]